MNLSERVKALRISAGWSQTELAEKAHVSQQLIAKIENNKLSESRKLPQIAAAFGLSVDELIHRVTGPRGESPELHLTAEERALIAAYRAASRAGKEAIIGAASGVAGSELFEPKGRHRDFIDDRPLGSAKKRTRRKSG